MTHPKTSQNVTSRRQFLRTTSMAAGTALAGGTVAWKPAARASVPAPVGRAKPNILFINTDQQGLDTISSLGCGDVHTPNLDRLAAGGTSFRQSYSADPVCCPARSCWFTGRAAAEHGVVMNSYPLHDDIPDLGQCFSSQGYDAFYSGKWHVPKRNPSMSFQFLPAGSGQGELCDGQVSRTGQAFFKNRTGNTPFFLTLGLLQPHDICYWIMQHATEIGELPYPELADKLPGLPPNFHVDPNEPATVVRTKRANQPGKPRYEWSELHWRYYLWSYYRHVEMVDAEIGRILDALADSRHAENTLVYFTADHGEGRARHKTTTKGFLYDEAARVPLIVSWPGQVGEGVVNDCLVSGLDFASTVCDYADIEAPPKQRGRSIRPLLEGQERLDRDCIVSSSGIIGRMVRTERYKYIGYQDDPVEQLFDMREDPWETTNLAQDAAHATVLAEHRKCRDAWEAQLEHRPIGKRVK